MKISKELFKEVLGEEVIETGSFNYPILEINVQRYSYREWQKINICEFAFKCKEWIVAQGYGIKTEPYDYMEDDSFSGTYWYIFRLRAENWKDRGCPGANATEIEAIIKACEWVLEKKD